jgi:hypothetical protein
MRIEEPFVADQQRGADIAVTTLLQMCRSRRRKSSRPLSDCCASIAWSGSCRVADEDSQDCKRANSTAAGEGG